MLAKIFKLAFSLILLVTSGFANGLEVVSLLDTEYKPVKDPKDFCKLALQESLRYHLNSVAGELGAPEWVKPTSKKFKTSVYNVIPSEIVRCMLDIKSYKHGSAEYGEFKSSEFKIMEFLEADGFVGLDKYTEANWNYFLFMNCLNMMINYDFDASETSIDTVVDVIKDTDEQYSTYEGKLNAAASDIKIYMSGLRLYEYIGELKSALTVSGEKPGSKPGNFISQLPGIESGAFFTDNTTWKFSVENTASFCPKDRNGSVQYTKYTEAGNSDTPLSHKKISGAPCGLKNLGETCYFNATMQFLYASEDFRELIKGVATALRETPGSDSVTIILDDLFNNMSVGTGSSYEPKEFNRLAKLLGGRMKYSMEAQNDASEFLGLLIGDFEKAMKSLVDKRYLEEYQCKFGSLLKSTFTANNGQHRATSTTRQEQIELEIANCPEKGAVDLGQLLTKFTCNIEDVEYTFPEENVAISSGKKTEIDTLAPNLILYLKRFTLDQSGSKTILDNIVNYPFELRFSGNKYHLRATIHHGGGLDSGHYWTNVYDRTGSLAYEANDSLVTTASQSHSASNFQTVYLLMYEKVN